MNEETKPIPMPKETMKRNYQLWKLKDILDIAKQSSPQQVKNLINPERQKRGETE